MTVQFSVRVTMQGVVAYGTSENIILPVYAAGRSRCSKTVDNTKAIIVLVASMQSRYHQVTHGVVKPIDNCNSSCPKCGCISKGGERMRAWSYDSLEGTPNTF